MRAYTLFILLSFFILNTFYGAQARSPEIEVDFQALEQLENYQPPPMFEVPDSGSEEQDMQDKIPAIFIREVPAIPPGNPSNLNNQRMEYAPAAPTAIFAKAPKPKIKPKITTYHTATKRMPHIRRIAKTPPLPPHRPKTLHASESFIRQARAQYGQASARPSLIEDVPSDDPLEAQLSSLNAQDILIQITDESLEKIPTVLDISQKLPENKPTEDVSLNALDLKKENENAYISLAYQPGIATLTAEIRASLKAQLIEHLKRDPSLRVEIRSFASSQEIGQSAARRISLARALDIRSFLIEHEIISQRIDIRPLGSKTTTTPLERSDIFLRYN